MSHMTWIPLSRSKLKRSTCRGGGICAASRSAYFIKCWVMQFSFNMSPTHSIPALDDTAMCDLFLFNLEINVIKNTNQL